MNRAAGGTSIPAVGPPFRVLLVENHELVLRGIASTIEQERDLTVVAEVASLASALETIDEVQPDVVLLDVDLPDGHGTEACRAILRGHPDATCLILASSDEDPRVDEARAAGASGWLLERSDAREFVDAVRRAAVGQNLMARAFSRRAGNRVAERQLQLRTLDSLTSRESQVLELMAEGLTNRQIGTRLGLTEKTAKNYASEVLHKLGLERRTQTARYVGALRGRV